MLIATAGVYLATDRRRALIGAALGVFAAMVVLGIVLAVARAVYLDHMPVGTSEDAAATVFDSLVRFLRAGVRAVGALALVTAAGAFLIGPSRIAALIRTGCRRASAPCATSPCSRGSRWVRSASSCTASSGGSAPRSWRSPRSCCSPGVTRPRGSWCGPW